MNLQNMKAKTLLESYPCTMFLQIDASIRFSAKNLEFFVFSLFRAALIFDEPSSVTSNISQKLPRVRQH
jgi:hypothetical protein